MTTVTKHGNSSEKLLPRPEIEARVDAVVDALWDLVQMLPEDHPHRQEGNPGGFVKLLDEINIGGRIVADITDIR